MEGGEGGDGGVGCRIRRKEWREGLDGCRVGLEGRGGRTDGGVREKGDGDG